MTQTLYAYWNDVRRDRIAPQRLEIQPAQLGELLPDTFILERSDGRTFRFRLAGTRICTRFGIELRGLNFLDRWTAGDRSMLEHHLAGITELGRVGVFTADVRFESGRTASVEIIVLPLVHTGAAIDRLLCAMSVLEGGEWPANEAITSLRLLSAEVVWPDGRPHAIADQLNRQSPLSPHVRMGRIVRQDRRQFRVYDGGLAKDDRGKL
jgi:hypothetical protein